MKAIIRERRNVTLQIISEQTADGDRHTSAYTAEGYFQEEPNGARTLAFREHIGERGEAPPSDSVISVQPDGRILLRRTGSYAAQLLFEEGKRHVCAYATPYGTMDLGVCTKTAQFRQKDEEAAQIELHYALDSGARMFTENNMKIIIKKRNDTK